MKDVFIDSNLSKKKKKILGIDSMLIIYKIHFSNCYKTKLDKILGTIRIIDTYLKIFKQHHIIVN